MPLLGAALIFRGTGQGVCAATPTPAPTAASTPAAAPAATTSATPDLSAQPTYDGAQQSKYIATADQAFLGQRQAKFQAYVDALNAFEAAGGVNSKGLTSKAALSARRDLLTKLQAANDDYLTFTTNQDGIYREELAKTPLVPSDINAVVQVFSVKQNTPRAIRFQQMEKDLLSDAGVLLDDLDKWEGKWSVNDAGKLTFKKKSNLEAYTDEERKYNALAIDIKKIQAEPAAPANPLPSAAPSAPPGATP
jgi:hypothetical protein